MGATEQEICWRRLYFVFCLLPFCFSQANIHEVSNQSRLFNKAPQWNAGKVCRDIFMVRAPLQLFPLLCENITVYQLLYYLTLTHGHQDGVSCTHKGVNLAKRWCILFPSCFLKKRATFNIFKCTFLCKDHSSLTQNINVKHASVLHNQSPISFLCEKVKACDTSYQHLVHQRRKLHDERLRCDTTELWLVQVLLVIDSYH